jgi:hypothetical protein
MKTSVFRAASGVGNWMLGNYSFMTRVVYQKDRLLREVGNVLEKHCLIASYFAMPYRKVANLEAQ